MAINFEDIKQNFFINYLRYWIIFLLCVLIYLLSSIQRYYFSTSNITDNIDNSIYITSGVAINNKYVITNKKAIEDSCFGRLTGAKGDFYIVDSRSIYGATIVKGDSISNMILLRLTNNQDSLDSYAIFDISQPRYSINRRLIVPVVFNKPGRFHFNSTRIVANSDNNFFIVAKDAFKKKDLSGMPVFNKNYVVLGIVREENNNYSGIISRDKILDKINMQKTYLVNGINTIKNFLNTYNVEYSVINGNTNLDNSTYNPRASVVNIICVQKY